LAASVHHVTPEGETLSTWDLNMAAQNVNHLALSPLGSFGLHLVVTDSDFYVDFYHSTTGIIHLTIDVNPYITDYPISYNKKFVVDARRNEDNMSVSVFISDKNSTQGVCAIDDRRNLLVLKDWDFYVVKITDSDRGENIKEISKKSGIVSEFKPRHHWYNEEHGLIFSPRNASLMVLRITY